MSSASLASLVTMACTPQTSVRRRAVARFGVSAITVEFGRSRAILNLQLEKKPLTEAKVSVEEGQFAYQVA
jgi:hypothetical protein